MGFFIICLIIFVGSLASGAVPFILNLSEKHLSLLSAFGAGLLVSTALAIILPEGIEAFSEASKESGSGPPHGVVALVIVGGFLVMLLADHLQGGSGHLRHAGRDSDDEEDIEEGLATGTIHHHKGASDLTNTFDKQKKQEGAKKAFVGLLVHSLADGLAVGTTGISDKEDLKLVVAFAMVLHKLPATFGLVTFLLASKWPTARVRRALLIFAASAPVMALATYWLLVLIPGFSSPIAVSLWLSASGGTFLYASCMHVLPHVASDEHRLTNLQVLAVICGSAVPVGIQFIGQHHH